MDNGGSDSVILDVLKEEGLTMTLKLTTIGNSTGLVLPRDILRRLRVDKGDLLHVVETPNGIELTPYDPEFDAQMEVAERVMREDRDVLLKLAE